MTDQEINELVAFKLGWEKVVGPAPMFHTVWIRKGNYGAGQKQSPDYVGDIKQAWEIVGNAGFYVELKRATNRRWRCLLGDMPEVVEADTAPLVICLAFLKLCNLTKRNEM